MKTFTKGLSGLLSASALAIGLLVMAQPASAQISGSVHNISAQPDGVSDGAPGAGPATTEICVYCHTPHGANTAIPAPLWNKGNTGSTYTTYVSSTMQGDTTDPGAISLACLTCHDGTQARDNMINKPGSGGYAAAGANLFTKGVISGTDNENLRLGTNLTNDHPIGMVFCAANAGPTGTIGDVVLSGVTECGDLDFNAGRVATNGTNYWVDTGAIDGVYQKSDFPLYNETVAGDGTVQCATCHDPHNPVGGGATFLRVANTSSSVCLTCHDK